MGKNSYMANKARYYSMTETLDVDKRKGFLSQQEAVWPECGVMLRTENTGWQQIIKNTIEHIQSCKTM